jgi:hypothetical protein
MSPLMTSCKSEVMRAYLESLWNWVWAVKTEGLGFWQKDQFADRRLYTYVQLIGDKSKSEKRNSV